MNFFFFLIQNDEEKKNSTNLAQNKCLIDYNQDFGWMFNCGKKIFFLEI